MSPQRSSRRISAAALSASLALVSAQAAAQGTTAATNQSAAAQARFDAGRQRFERSEWEGALEEFRASLELYRSPNTRLYIGLCLLRLDRVADAFNELTRTVNEASDLARADRRYEATRDRAQRELAPLDARVARMTLRAVDPPPGLTVRVGGHTVSTGALGVPLAFDPGNVEVVGEAPGFRTFRQAVRLSPGATASIEIGMQALAPQGVVTPSLGVSPVGAGPSVQSRGGGVRVAGFVVGALGLAGLGMFVGFGLQAQQRYDALVAACRGGRCPASNIPAIDEGAQWQNLANIGLGAGIGLLVTGVIMVAVGGPRAVTEASSGRPTVRLWTDPSQSALGVAGAF